MFPILVKTLSRPISARFVPKKIPTGALKVKILPPPISPPAIPSYPQTSRFKHKSFSWTRRSYCSSNINSSGSRSHDAFSPNSDNPNGAISSNSSHQSNNHSSVEVEAMPIFELTSENLQQNLTGAIPVVVFAYMPGSELCQQLEAKLASRVMKFEGSVRLAKLNTSEQGELAAALKLSQLPAVLGVVGGQAVTSFVGVPDDTVLDNFIDVMLRVGSHSTVQSMVQEAEQLMEAGSLEEATKIFQEILLAPAFKAEATALAGIARCFIKEGKFENAKELLDVIDRDFSKEKANPTVMKAFSAFELVSNANSSSSSSSSGLQEKIAELQSLVKSNPDDLQAKYDLASAFVAASNQKDAIDILLDIIKRDREWNQQAAKKMLLKIWESLGNDHNLTISSRKRFSSIWFL